MRNKKLLHNYFLLFHTFLDKMHPKRNRRPRQRTSTLHPLLGGLIQLPPEEELPSVVEDVLDLSSGSAVEDVLDLSSGSGSMGRFPACWAHSACKNKDNIVTPPSFDRMTDQPSDRMTDLLECGPNLKKARASLVQDSLDCAAQAKERAAYYTAVAAMNITFVDTYRRGVSSESLSLPAPAIESFPSVASPPVDSFALVPTQRPNENQSVKNTPVKGRLPSRKMFSSTSKRNFRISCFLLYKISVLLSKNVIRMAVV